MSFLSKRLGYGLWGTVDIENPTDAPHVTIDSPVLTPYRNTALSNTAQAVKATSGKISDLFFYNQNNADVFVHFYDTAVGNVTVGVTTPLISYWVPANGSLDRVVTFPFSNAISLACSTTLGGGTAPTSGILAMLGYQ